MGRGISAKKDGCREYSVCVVSEFGSCFGALDNLHTDQGRYFESRLFKEACSLLGVRKTSTTTYHPAGDGLVEWLKQTQERVLAHCVSDHQYDWESWDIYLTAILMAYTVTPHGSTGYSPAYLLFRREMCLPRDVAYRLPPATREAKEPAGCAKDLRQRLSEVNVIMRERLHEDAMKTKFLVVGDGITAVDRAPMNLGGVDIVCVDEFRYLGSSIHHSGHSTDDVDARVAAASRACGASQKSVFAGRYLDIHIKRCVFNACALSLLLYGLECWTSLQCDIRRLSSFHMRCIHSILGITRARAWAEHISNAELLALWGDTDTIEEQLAHRRLEWLGHVARMEDSRMPRQVLFGTFLQCRPAHRPRKRWKDGVVRDLRSCDLLASWFDLARESRSAWRNMYSSVACNQHRMQPVECFVYVIGLLLALVIELGTSDRRRGLDQSRIRREIGIVIVVIVGFEVRVEWLSIVVVVRHQFQLLLV